MRDECVLLNLKLAEDEPVETIMQANMLGLY